MSDGLLEEGLTRKSPAPGPPVRGIRAAAPWIGLVILPLLAFAPVFRSGFVTYDDDSYVTNNEHVRAGLSSSGVAWAFRSGAAANWHPLTWLSHMTDVSLFGLNPAGHHGTNLLLHVVNTLLLFLLFRRLTGKVARSFWVAAVFAVHPAHVESVAWVAERKDVLCTLFWLLALLAYVSWTQHPGRIRYFRLCFLFACGLMAKPMIVTFPLTLLLIDFWPLARLSADGGREGGRGRFVRVILEKMPLFAMAAVSAVITVIVQRSGGAVGSLQRFPLSARLENSVVAYARYLRMFFWPSGLAVFYPHPGASLAPTAVAGAALLLAAITVAVLLLRRQAPYLLFGWLWFLVTLFPVIGIVQVGWQALADRYTYVPFVGLSVAVAWAAGAAGERWTLARGALRATAAAALVALAAAAAVQVRFWKDTEQLFLRAIAVTRSNYVALSNLGNFYNDQGHPAKAMPLLQEAVGIRPDYSEAYTNLGHSLFLLGRLEEAGQHFAESLRIRPDFSIAIADLAWVRFLQGEIGESVALYRRSLGLAPSNADARKRLAIGLLIQGNTAGAVDELRKAIEISPSDAEIRPLLDGATTLQESPSTAEASRVRGAIATLHVKTAERLLLRRKRAEALSHLQAAVALAPDLADAHARIGALLLEDGRIDEAAVEFQRVLSLVPDSAVGHNDMGYLWFLKGETRAAIAEYREALRLQPDLELAQSNLKRALETERDRPSRPTPRR